MNNLIIAPWFERKFSPISNLLFPVILERLQGTVVRVQEKIKNIPEAVLTQKEEKDWSIQEHIGHLVDLEPLWIGRIADIRQGHEFLRQADLSNQKTFQAGHNNRPIEEIVSEFENYRKQMIEELMSLNAEDLEKSSLHPRLKTPMHLIDLMNFVAEHDDHHLAFCSQLIRAYS